MHYVTRIISFLVFSMLFITPVPAGNHFKTQNNVWRGTLRDGTEITKDDLLKILNDHKKWFETNGKAGRQANLEGANLKGADFTKANLMKARLRGSDLSKSCLRGAFISWADAVGTRLNGADLQGSHIYRTNLRWADLAGAKLQNADIKETDLTGVRLFVADLYSVVFEPKLGALPEIKSLATAHNLFTLTFRDSPHALIELRNEFRKYGFRDQERQITYAIKRAERNRLWKKGGLPEKIESLLNYFLFEITCEYGMSPWRPFTILALLIILGTLFYVIVVKRPGKDGIWKVWPAQRIRKDQGQEGPTRLKPTGIHLLWWCLYFSLLSAFHIGWRDFNVGSWINRIQRHEYALRATGWARTLSGIQSLISVYLLALWVLTYFGRPFD